MNYYFKNSSHVWPKGTILNDLVLDQVIWRFQNSSKTDFGYNNIILDCLRGGFIDQLVQLQCMQRKSMCTEASEVLVKL